MADDRETEINKNHVNSVFPFEIGDNICAPKHSS